MRYLLLLAAALPACGSDDLDPPSREGSCFASALVEPIALAASAIHPGRDLACIGQRREDVLSTIESADDSVLVALRAKRDGVLPWSTCDWLPSQHGQESRGDYPVAGEPQRPAVAIVVGGFRCEASTAELDIGVVDSINDIVSSEGYLCAFTSDGNSGWNLEDCSLSWTS